MAAITILDKNNAPTGPFTREQVAGKLQSGEFSPEQLAFVEGLSNWTPLREVLAKVDAAAPPPPPAVTSAPVAGGYSYAATMQPPPHFAYAGFWLRFVAYFVDSLVIGAVVMVIGFFIGLIFGLAAPLFGANLAHLQDTDSNTANPAAVALFVAIEVAIWAVSIVVSWLYFAKLESGPAQATLGKRVLGLRVTNLAGERISFGRASGRFFGKILSALPLDIGFIMAAFTERKQALHDMIAGTLVVRS